MAIIEFPPIESADENGLIGIGGDLEVESLLLAYSQGIFPWPISKEYPLAWFSPNPRGIIFFDNLHISNSLKKFIKKNPYQVRFNTNFESVILNCARIKRKHEDSTWITDKIIEAYIEFHRKGYAYSVEVYKFDPIENGEKLVGGLYGVKINNYVCGESMFYKEENASKIALITLIQSLKNEGITWLDTQMITPVVEGLGGIYIARELFLELLQKSIHPLK